MAGIRRALIKATRERNVVALKKLLENGANVEMRFDEGITLLIYAAMFAKKLVKPLLNAGADVNAKDRENRTPLLCAVLNGDANTTRILLKNGAKPNVVNNYGFTPLMCAAEGGHAGIVRMLLEAGAAVDRKSSTGHTALMKAVTHGRRDIVRMLIAGRA
jgi:ankyrin repeat protein